jgi:hypothetical protein
MTSIEGLSLEFSDGRAAPTTFEGVNAELHKIGAGIWPLDLRNHPGNIRDLLAKRKLDQAELQRVQEHFLLPRDRLLEIVRDAGRSTQVPGGGVLTTFVTNHDYGYPQLFQVEEGVDYTRFDRFHRNVGPDGIGVDEVFQLLSGGGLVIHQRLEGGEVLTLTLHCPAPDQGWLGTYDGARPHIGSVGSAAVGSKLLVQAFGAPRWVMQYED